MIGGVSSIGSSYYNPYANLGMNRAQQAQQAQQSQQTQQAQRPSAILTAQRAASPEVPVQPVTPVKAVNAQATNPATLGVPIREGVDPVEMAVRMRIQPYQENTAANQTQSVLGQQAQKAELPGVSKQADLPGAAKQPEIPGLPNQTQEEPEIPGLPGQKTEGANEAKSAQEVMEEGECQTCKERKYQDGSDDPGVSFKTPTNIDPSQAAAAVRGHEMEHVTREQAKAVQEDRKVVSQSVTYHTDICPECGDVYVSGGTTRTVTAADNSDQLEQQAQQQRQEQQERQPFSAIA